MMKRMTFLLYKKNGEVELIEFSFSKLLLGGWTGRRREDVLAHIEELKRVGIPAPERVPCFFPVSPSLLDNCKIVYTYGEKTNGEVEYVLLVEKGEPRYVTVGSDHTDREIERFSVPLSKRLYPKIVAPVLWSYDEIRDHWDELILSMEVDGELSQESKLDSILFPEDLVALSEINEENAVIFSGSIGWRGGILKFGMRYKFSLVDPVLGRRILYRYETKSV